MPRIAHADVAEINQKLSARIDDLEKRIITLQRTAKDIHETVFLRTAADAPHTTNNLIFTWTGGTGTLSWPAGHLVDARNINTPVMAGSLNLSPSTFYWLSWNKQHQQLQANKNATGLLQNPNNIIICQIFTGTAGQSGVAGGGGSQSASDLSGARYKNF